MPRKTRIVSIDSTVGALLTEAFGEVEDLANEMAEWRDNMPESLQGSDKYERVSECAEMLENQHSEDPGAPTDEVSSLPCSYNESKKGKKSSRQMRLTNATAKMDAAREAMQQYFDELPDDEAEENTDLKDLIEKIEEIVNELEQVDFPGMMG